MGPRGDGGMITFVDAMLSPGFSTGRPMILVVGGDRLLEYHVDTGELQVLALAEECRATSSWWARYLSSDPAGPTILVASTRPLMPGV